MRILKFKNRAFRLFSTGGVMPLFAVFMVLVLSGCRKGVSSDDNIPEGQGVICFSGVNIDTNLSQTKISAEDLAIRIENTRGDILKTWASIAEVPEFIKVVPGSYKLAAAMGAQSNLPSFNDDYFGGESKFAIEEREQIEVTINAKYISTKVKVDFDTESFENSYDAYKMELKTTTPSDPYRDSLTYDATTAGMIGNFMPGTLRMRMIVTPKGDDKEYMFYPKPITGLDSAELRTLKMKIVSTSGTANLQITTDFGYEHTEEIELLLPSAVLPKAAPTVLPNNFEMAVPIEGNEALVDKKYSATILAPGGVKSVKIRSNSPSVTELWGGHSELEFVGASVEVSNLLSSIGLRWDNSLNSEETANIKYNRFNISFGDMFGALTAEVGSEYTDYSFEIEVIDMYNQSNVNSTDESGKFYFTMRVFPPLYGWSAAPSAGNVWSHHAEFDIYSRSTTTKKPTIWIKEGDGNWMIAENQIFEQEADKAEGIGVQRIPNLTPSTQYTFRLMMGNHTTEDFVMATEDVQAIENGNMEKWQAEKLGTSMHNIPYYTPAASGESQYWDTNNDRTTSYRQLACTYGYNSFPAVAYTRQACNGTYAAEVRSISASNIHGLNTTSITQKHSQVAGELLIGDFEYIDKTDKITLGKAYATRPESFSFNYTYQPYDSEESFSAEIVLFSGDTEIGRGSYVSAKGEAQNTYTEQKVAIDYSNRRLRADKMGILFKSTTTSPAPVHKVSYDIEFDGQGDSYTDGWGIWLGAILRIDDVAVQC